MVKLFSSKKSGKGQQQQQVKQPSAASSAGIRAEYYANRSDNSNFSNNEGGVGARTITFNAADVAGGATPPNPFADDSDDDDDNGGAIANSGKNNANPFDDDSVVAPPASDPLAAFRKTPAKTSTIPPTTAPNPFADDDSDDDESNDEKILPPPPNSSVVQRSTAVTNNNPFSVDGGGDSLVLPTKSSTANPFDDDDDDNEEEEEDKVFRRPMDLLVGMGKMNSKRLNADNDPFLQEVISNRKSPKAIPPPPRRQPPTKPDPVALIASTVATSNPFEDDDEEDKEEVITARAKSMAASGVAVAIPRSPSTRMNKSTNQSLPSPSTAAASPVPSSRESIEELRNRLSGGGGGGAPPRSAPSSNISPVSSVPSVMKRPITAPVSTPTVEGGDKKLSSLGGGVSGNAVGLSSWLRGNKKEDRLLVGIGDNVFIDNKKNAVNDKPSSLANGSNAPASSGVGDLERKMQIHNLVGNLNGNQRTATATTTNSGVSGGTNKKRRPKKKKCSVVTPWPFDNYHEVQQEAMYEELASRAASDYNGTGTDHGEYAYGGDNNNINDTKKDDNSRSRMNAHQGWAKLKTASQKGGLGRFANAVTIAAGVGGSGMNNNNRDTITYERPQELPRIKEAVNDLPLIDFEKKAEERAINIVSTWLFDAGLIDELLVNGATVSTPHQQQQRISSNATTTSEKTSEGQEIGAHGFLVGVQGADLKMDKETNKLRTMIQRDLSIINARLNDGVAASGLEVHELVNAVITAKEDIGRLRELTTYISDEHGPNSSSRDEFLLAKYPYLRKAINARRNINRCFRELDFFGHIPSTCERLRDDLNSGEYTEEEWTTIRNVSMEHVELEIMLVEAEDSMKSGAHSFNDAVVDTFLEAHVQNVWELGDEIRMRILSGIGTAFELSKNNPLGMVALVEAVEMYERAAETFEKKRDCGFGTSNGGDNRLRFTDMRAAALEQLYQDFELRGVEMFRGVHEHAADLADEDDAANVGFTAVLKAATELVTEIDIVKDQMSPCFAPHWHVEALWSSCVAHVCSNHIVQQIGGPDGQSLLDLTITQLLELVAWVEYFRETIEETFPVVALLRNTKKMYYDMNGPELFTGDKRTVNMKNATESIAWVNNMLWEVHRLAQEEFLVRTRSQTDEWLDKVYGSESVKNQSAEGKLTTSLCEDIFSFTSVQLQTIRERLSKKSDALILAVCIILSHMRSKQVHARNNTLQDLETCCAASNDFTRMSEKTEDMVSELMSECEFSEDMVATLEASSEELMGVYSSDAVYSARSVHIYVFDPIEEEIGVRLFEEDWENVMIDNDLAISLVRTLEDFHEDLVHYMDDFMVVKSMMSLMSATVIFYAKCLLQRAETHRNNKKPYFGDVKTALDRMTGDIKVLRDYFESLVPQMPTLKKNVDKDFEILTTIHELLSIAAGISVSEVEDFILVLQKRVRDVGITKHIVGDLWHLVAPTEERYVWELVESMEERLTAIAPPDDALALEVNDRAYVKGLRLDEMAVKLIIKSRRNRPIKASAVENIVKNWGKTWFAGNEDVIHEETP